MFSLAITTEPVMVLVACGPYTPSDSLTFDPLLDLINVIVRDRPDVCILVQFCLILLFFLVNLSHSLCVWFNQVSFSPQLGPFVDSKHEQIEVFLATPENIPSNAAVGRKIF